jgi:hypothetical protein
MRGLALLLSGFMVLPALPAGAQDVPGKLNLVIVEGEGAINNIKQRTAREPVVQVEDENHRPVAGAAVLFDLPGQGASGTFPDGGHSLTVITDDRGRAVARGLRPNNVQGKFEIHVTASHNGQTGTATITMSNAMAGAGAAGASAGISGKLIAVIVVAAAAAAGGAIYATHSGGGSASSIAAGPSLVTISPGTGTVGAPGH